MTNLDFEKKLDDLAEKPAAEATPTAGGEVKRGRGRPKGSLGKKEVITPALPIVNEIESAIWAAAFAGVANAFLKEPYKEALRFTNEELLNVTRPLVQLKDYYAPNFGGVYTIWASFGVGVVGLGAAKYNVIQEIIKNAKSAEKNNANIRDAGNREKHVIEGTITTESAIPSL